MLYFRFSKIATVLFLCLFFIRLPFSVGQDVPATPAETGAPESAADPEPVEPLRIGVSVNEIRLDVVVLDRRGNPVTDLTAADFEVFQNGARQNVISSVYIDNQPAAAKPPPAQKTARNNNRNIPPIPTVNLKREDINRTLILLMDDLSMSFENIHFARMALRNFVEKQMQPGDMVAIIRTGRGNSALQMFLSDKREVLARIDAMRFERGLTPTYDGSHLYRIYENQLSTISYSIRALKDMPGRKMLVVMTATPALRRSGNSSFARRIDFHALYNDRFSRLADDVLRAGIVVNFLNIHGLQNTPRLRDIQSMLGQLRASQQRRTVSGDGTITIGGITSTWETPLIHVNNLPGIGSLPGDTSGELRSAVEIAAMSSSDPGTQLLMVQQLAPYQFEAALNAEPTNALNPLPVKTGGVIIENSNFFLDGIGRETESLMRGYYLISYAPPSGTFSSGGSSDKETFKEVFNRIRVNVRRRGLQVHTRDGFYNRLESGMAADAPPVHPLQDAVFSPFLHTGLDVNVAAGYVKDAKAGHIVRSWIHVDPKDITVVETEDGGARIGLEIVSLTSDTNGFVQDFKFVEHTLTIEPENRAENLAWIEKHGIRFAVLLPVKNTGFYYVRVAVRDMESGNTGSAYQSVEIPDPGRRGLSMSNIFMIPGVDDLNWLLSGATTETGLFFPVFQAEEVKSPALGTYAPGDSLQVLAMLYNADEKTVAASGLEMRFVLYRDGKEFMSGGNPVGPGSAGNLDGIPLLLRLTMGTDIPPGDYVLQLNVTDKRNSQRREGNASQAISFTVTE